MDVLLKLKDVLSETDTKTKTCKGQVFRGTINNYVTGERIVSKYELRILKSKFCPGCECCSWLMEMMDEYVQDDMIDFTNLKHGSIYKLKPKMCQDRESGNNEIDGFELVEWKPEEKDEVST